MSSSIAVDLQARIFTVTHDGTAKRFSIPDGYEVRTTDLKEILEVGNSIIGGDAEHWWEVHHRYRKEPGRYRCQRFTLHHLGERNSFDCYVQWECDAEGYERAHAFRGSDQGEDRLGGIITSQDMELFLYKVACDEEQAMKEGYVLEGRWLLRVIDDDTGALVQMRIPASWTKPPRWKAIPID